MKKKKLRYNVILSLIAIAVSCGLIFSVVSQVIRIHHRKQELAILEKQRQKLVKEKASLNKEVKELEEDDYIVRYARDHYIFSKDGEKAVVLPDGNKEQ